MGCGTNVNAKEIHAKFVEILNALKVKPEFSPLICEILERKFIEKEGDAIENRRVILKNVSEIETKIKNVVRRFADGDIGDQVRVTTPAKAKEIGSDYIVVGRPITAAEDPVAAYRRCVAEFVG